MYALKDIENPPGFSRLICTGRLTFSLCAAERLIKKSRVINKRMVVIPWLSQNFIVMDHHFTTLSFTAPLTDGVLACSWYTVNSRNLPLIISSMGFKFEGRMMATNIKKCKFSNPNSGPAIQARASQTVSLCRATIPLRGGGDSIMRALQTREQVASTCFDCK